MTREIVYYTCNTHLPAIDEQCRTQLLKAADGLPIVSVSLNMPLDFGVRQITIEGVRSPEMMHRQVLLGLEAATADYVYLIESDVMYHPSHFSEWDSADVDDNTFYYNTNVWKQRWPDHFYIWTDDLQQVSGIFANRKLLLEFYTKRNVQIAKEGFNRHYEPGVKQTVGSRKAVNWQSLYPNICIRHDNNITKSKWSPEEFRNKDNAKGWKESTRLPGW